MLTMTLHMIDKILIAIIIWAVVIGSYIKDKLEDFTQAYNG
jgi:flagellar biosynthesis protein FliQ